MTPYCPPAKKIAFANVACSPVSRASSAGSSTPFTRAVRQSISWRQAKSGFSARMRPAVRSMSSFPSMPAQWSTLKLISFISAESANPVNAPISATAIIIRFFMLII